MNQLILLRNLFVASFCTAIISACTPNELVPPTPTALFSVRKARFWHETTHQLTKVISTGSSADSGTVAPWALDWNRARMISGPDPLVVVPFQGDNKLFAGQLVQGARCIVIEQRPPATRPTGQIIELLLKRSKSALDTVALFADLYRGFRSGIITAPVQGVGQVIFYSSTYQYRTGRHFEKGVIRGETARLAFHHRKPDSTTGKQANTLSYSPSSIHPTIPTNNYDSVVCTDWYQDNGDGTYTYITTTGDCSSPPGSGETSSGPFSGHGDTG